MPVIEIYTDGACKGNPGPGGYGVVLMSGHHRKELSQGYKHTTNNRMELMAVIAGLKALAPALAARLNADVIDVLKSAKIRGQFAEQGADPGALPQPEFTRFVDAEIVKWGKVITAANVKLD